MADMRLVANSQRVHCGGSTPSFLHAAACDLTVGLLILTWLSVILRTLGRYSSAVTALRTKVQHLLPTTATGELISNERPARRDGRKLRSL